MAESKRILDVGQCVVDGPRIRRFLTRELGATVDQANTPDEALSRASNAPYDLVLVNRLLDRDRSRGVDVIAALHAAHPALRTMLVSDLPEAQEEAVRLGALRGFGKSKLESTETEELLRGVLSGT